MSGHSAAGARWRRVARPVFFVFAAALATATHWPGLVVHGPLDRPDLLVHLSSFGLWSMLLILCRFFGPTLSPRNVIISASVAIGYAALDELTQLFPILHRTAAVDDFLADVIGVGAATIAAGLASLSLRRSGGIHGPLVWLISLVVGLLIGGVCTTVITPEYEEAPVMQERAPLTAGDRHAKAEPEAGAEEIEHALTPKIPLILCVPFAMLLASIALMPFVNEPFWHHHFPDFAFLFAGVVIGYYLIQFNQPYEGGLSYGTYQMLHVAHEYFAFIALVGALYVVSGGVLIEVRGRGRPIANVVLLGLGAVFANIVGTTGASVLLIRPFMKLNADRLHAIHIVLFIFIVSNCGGCLTPVGDPPLYLGYLKGVPFFWTLEHLWPMWITCIGALLLTFWIIDSRVHRRSQTISLDEVQPVDPNSIHESEVAEVTSASGRYSVRLRGSASIICLAAIIGAVFVDPMLESQGIDTYGFPAGPVLQVIIAAISYKLAPKKILEANEFSFFPVKEVGLLFIGIFATMAPALGYLAAHGHSLGIDTPTALYFSTGSLSAVLDNAPTYANFLQIAFGPAPMNHETVRAFALGESGHLVQAVSLGAVFFGAFTYIGNAPNFMVKSIAERAGVKMPSFFGYTFRAVLFLSPSLILVWAIFVR